MAAVVTTIEHVDVVLLFVDNHNSIRDTDLNVEECLMSSVDMLLDCDEVNDSSIQSLLLFD